MTRFYLIPVPCWSEKKSGNEKVKRGETGKERKGKTPDENENEMKKPNEKQRKNGEMAAC